MWEYTHTHTHVYNLYLYLSYLRILLSGQKSYEWPFRPGDRQLQDFVWQVSWGYLPPHTRLGAQLVNYSFLDTVQSRTQPLTLQSNHVHAHSCIPSLSTSFRVFLIKTLAQVLSRCPSKSCLLGPSTEALFSILTGKYLFTLSSFLSPFSLGPQVHKRQGSLVQVPL